ncbi:hypothetical protein [Microbacterium ulmi]|uniref:Uncharacterized protein n=1 Tax=Microbacterium ulmi TaxID=179095 RepID=A0A7Y2Q2W6_9MICO|nr:hypothetical protein [Microbacterium ulmi]NII68603.1 hypothetical protein [Microbacterium ulmi]NNH05425.1 hypothetical protein [Microbacterium ulmi]
MSTPSTPQRPASSSLTAAAAPARAGASSLPLIVGSAALAVSVAIAVVVAIAASGPVAVLGIPVPLVRSDAFWLSLVGYLLTPFVVVACYGWDVLAQRDGLRANRNFVVRPAWTRRLLWLAGAGILVGLWHILNLSVPLSEWMGFA